VRHPPGVETMRIFLLLHMALGGLVVAQTNAPDSLQRRVERKTMVQQEIVAGKWKVWVTLTLADDPRTQAPAYDRIVYRQGPNDIQPSVLFRETTNRAVLIWLREDGTTIIEGGDTPRPLLSFPYKQPIEITLPGPAKWEYPFPPDVTIGKMWFMDDLVVYSRNPGPKKTLIGFFRIDTANHRVVDNKVSLEVAEERPDPAGAAEIRYGAPLFRVGDFVFWVNEGGNTAASEPWRERKVRALDLKANTVIDANDVPREVLREHKAKLLDYLEKTDHYSRKEMEAWFLSMIGEVGTKDDLGRLTAMEAKVHSKKALYTKAVAAISAR
jgi:hypothetical protein